MDPDIDEDMWVLRRVFTVKELKNKNNPIICNCFGDGKCDLVACSEWRSKDDYCYSCIDCQEHDYDGWPEPESGELPLEFMTKEHRKIIMDKCSKQYNPKMPNVPTSAPLPVTAAASKGKKASATTPPPREHSQKMEAKNQTNVVDRMARGDKGNGGKEKAPKGGYKPKIPNVPTSDASAVTPPPPGQHHDGTLPSDGNGEATLSSGYAERQSIQKQKSDATNTADGETMKASRLEENNADQESRGAGAMEEAGDWISQINDIVRKKDRSHNSRLQKQIEATNDLQKALDLYKSLHEEKDAQIKALNEGLKKQVETSNDLQKALDLEKSSNEEKDAQITPLKEQLDAERKGKSELQTKMDDLYTSHEEAKAELEDENKLLQQELATEKQNHQQLKNTLLSLVGAGGNE